MDDRYTASGILLSVLLLSSIAFSSCALPRIIVLDDPLSPEEHLNLGVTYEAKKEFDLAIKQYKMAMKGDTEARAFLYTGNAYFEKGDAGEAERYYKKAIDRDPKLADAYNNLAYLYAKEKRNLREAEELINKAIALNPSKESAYRDTLREIKGLQ